jgi:hypothetical protein
MAYRNKTYVCFDGDKDIQYYYLMKAWKASDHIDFDFYDAHDLNTARDSSQETSIKKQLSLRLQSSKLMVVLIGESTKYLTKFVKWEMEQAIQLGIPLIAVNLNSMGQVDDLRCPPTIRNQRCLHIPFKQKAMEWALDNWIGIDADLKAKGIVEPRVLSKDLSVRLGL